MSISRTICLAERVTRAFPVNMKPGDESLFRHELVRDLEAMWSWQFENVDLLPNGYLVSREGILRESFHSSANNNVFFKQRLKALYHGAVARTTTTVGKALFATDEFSNGYFHWVCDVLPRLEAAVRSGALDRTVMVPAMAAAPYVAATLEPYGFSGVHVATWKERIHCRDLQVIAIAAPTGNYRPSLMASLRERFRDYFRSGQAERKIYVSRARAARRRIVNEDRVQAVLARHGYESLTLEDLPFAEQVQVIGSAKVLVGNHGAGLANIAWMLPGATVMELRLVGDRHNNCYFSLAAAQGVQYRYLVCRSAAGGASVHTADISVDEDELERELAAIG